MVPLAFNTRLPAFEAGFAKCGVLATLKTWARNCADALSHAESPEQRGIQIDLAGPTQHVETGRAEANLGDRRISQRIEPGLAGPDAAQCRDVRLYLVRRLRIARRVQRGAVPSP